jgi:hypothetical protein
MQFATAAYIWLVNEKRDCRLGYMTGIAGGLRYGLKQSGTGNCSMAAGASACCWCIGMLLVHRHVAGASACCGCIGMLLVHRHVAGASACCGCIGMAAAASAALICQGR